MKTEFDIAMYCAFGKVRKSANYINPDYDYYAYYEQTIKCDAEIFQKMS